LKAKNTINPETTIPQIVVTAVDDEQEPTFESISVSLAEIRKLKGVTGYILRSETSAVIDLDESDKIIEYATLSYLVQDSCLQIAKYCRLGDVESMIAEGEKAKVFCTNIKENRISVFMEKSATHAEILSRILP